MGVKYLDTEKINYGGEKPSITASRRSKIGNNEKRGVSNFEKYIDGFAKSLRIMTYVISAVPF